MSLGSFANAASGWLPVCLHLGVLLCFLSCPPTCLPQIQYSARLVETAYGSLRGIILPRSGTLTRDVEGFLGVPYASAPAASLRFMPPLTPSHWQGVRVADKFGPVCPQVLPNIGNRSHSLSKMPLLKYTKLTQVYQLLSNQSEDCLYLNIYMPVKDEKRGGWSWPKEGLPVVVILGGDSWEWGSGNLIDGSALASHGNVMVVTLNYRLGVLGFLQTTHQQGNFAIMDIVAGLNWIRENAGAFGADVNKVTLLGHRTGAVLANFLMLAPVATELFHRVILLSGSALSPWSFQRHARTNIRKLGGYFNCYGESPTSSSLAGLRRFSDSGGLMAGDSRTGVGSSLNLDKDTGPCLRGVSLEKLMEVVKRELVHPRFIARFGPLIDNYVVKSDFVSEMKLDSNGYFSRIPMLIGASTIESFSELNTEDIEDGLPEQKRDRILRTLVRNVFVFHLNEIYSTIKNEYTDWEKPRKDFIDVRDSILNILSDGLTVAPLIQVASMHAHKTNSKTFFFHFKYEPDKSVYPHRIGSISEDLLEFALGYALTEAADSRESSLPRFSQNDVKAAKNLLEYLINFINSGDPNQGQSRSQSPEGGALPKWDPYDVLNQPYLELATGAPVMRNHYRGHKMALWLNLIPQLHQSGGADVSMIHHNFREDKPEFYDGPVREQIHGVPSTDVSPALFPPSPGHKPGLNSRERLSGSLGPPGYSAPDDEDEDSDSSSSVERFEGGQSPRGPASGRGGSIYPTSAPTILSTSECPPNATHNASFHGNLEGVGGSGKNAPGHHELGTPNSGGSGSPGSANSGSSTGSTDKDIARQLAASHYHSYGTALGVTIGVGCCLLLLNLLIFLAIYHQKTQNNAALASESSTLPKNQSTATTEELIESTTSLCRRHSDPRGLFSQGHGMSLGFPYGDMLVDEYEEEEMVHHRLTRECASSSTSFLMKDLSSSSGFSSPPIPEPPPPPRSIPPSLAGSMVSIASSTSGGILRRPPERERDRDSSGSMKKRVQIQEISV